MSDQEVEAFLCEQSDMPAELRRKMLVHYTGTTPMWNVGTMLRTDDTIVVIGTWRRQRPRLHVVHRWYWSTEEIGVWWQSFKKSKDATEQNIRIDSPHVVFERSGLRTD